MDDKDKAKVGGSIPPAVPTDPAALVQYAPGAVVSRTIKKSEKGTLTLFAFSAGQELSEHSAPFDAFVQVLDGEATLIIGGQPVKVAAGQLALMPADVPHAVKAERDFKMLLVMIK